MIIVRESITVYQAIRLTCLDIIIRTGLCNLKLHAVIANLHIGGHTRL